MCGLGEFQLVTPFGHHAVSQMRWNAMKDDARAHAFSRLMSDTGSMACQQQRTVTSSPSPEVHALPGRRASGVDRQLSALIKE